VVHDVADQKDSRDHERREHAALVRLDVLAFDEDEAERDEQQGERVQGRVDGRQDHARGAS
jgi:hypothetical protein